MQFSVVIPTKDRLDDLTQCIQSVLGQTKKPQEIIVVDGGIHQQIEGRITEMCDKEGIPFKYIKQTEGKFGRAKNIGAMQAEGNIVLFVDDDVILDKRYIEELERVYQEDVSGSVGGVQGICTNIPTYNLIKKAYFWLFMLGGWHGTKSRLLPTGACVVPAALSSTTEAAGFVGSGHSYRKSVFDEFKFDEEFEFGDELNFSVRVSQKHQLYMIPHAKFVHNQSPVARNIEVYQTMNTYARYHLFRKLIPQTLKNRLCFLWSHIGFVIGYLGVFLVKPTKQNLAYTKGSIKGTVTILRSIIHRKDVP